MASNYNITMKQYNGTDYDTLYPKTKGAQVAVSDALATELGVTAGSDVDTAISNVVRAPIIVTLPVSGWSSTAPYTQSVACAGLLATDDYRTQVRPVGNASDPDAQALTDAAYGCVDYFACTTNGQLYARCPSTLPEVDFQVAVVICR